MSKHVKNIFDIRKIILYMRFQKPKPYSRNQKPDDLGEQPTMRARQRKRARDATLRRPTAHAATYRPPSNAYFRQLPYA